MKRRPILERFSGWDAFLQLVALVVLIAVAFLGTCLG